MAKDYRCTKCGGTEYKINECESWHRRCVKCNAEGRRAYQLANLEKTKLYNRSYTKSLRAEVIAHYGGVCACCKEDTLEFLVIDHVNGGGTRHRKELGNAGRKMDQWLKRNGLPSGYRILCSNCNSSFGFHGYCPHEVKATREKMRAI